MTTDTPTETERPDWADAGEQVAYCWKRLANSRTPLDQAQSLVDLSDAMHDLCTFLPGYDYKTGTLPFERDEF